MTTDNQQPEQQGHEQPRIEEPVVPEEVEPITIAAAREEIGEALRELGNKGRNVVKEPAIEATKDYLSRTLSVIDGVLDALTTKRGRK